MGRDAAAAARGDDEPGDWGRRGRDGAYAFPQPGGWNARVLKDPWDDPFSVHGGVFFSGAGG